MKFRPTTIQPEVVMLRLASYLCGIVGSNLPVGFRKNQGRKCPKTPDSGKPGHCEPAKMNSPIPAYLRVAKSVEIGRNRAENGRKTLDCSSAPLPITKKGEILHISREKLGNYRNSEPMHCEPVRGYNRATASLFSEKQPLSASFPSYNRGAVQRFRISWGLSAKPLVSHAWHPPRKVRREPRPGQQPRREQARRQSCLTPGLLEIAPGAHSL